MQSAYGTKLTYQSVYSFVRVRDRVFWPRAWRVLLSHSADPPRIDQYGGCP
jgi:hypothetical protein